MKKKNVIQSLCLLVFITSIAFAGCGSCPGDIKKDNSVKKSTSKTNISNALVMSVPEDNIINGLVITSCGMCNLNTKDKNCNLSIKIGNKIFDVDGTKINEHGDEHGKIGFCNAVRVAWAKGKIVKEIFYAETFSLVGN